MRGAHAPAEALVQGAPVEQGTEWMTPAVRSACAQTRLVTSTTTTLPVLGYTSSRQR